MDGPGMHPVLLNLVRPFVKGAKVLDKITMPFKNKEEQEAIKRKFKAQGVKDVLSETTAKKVFMTTRIDKLIVPSFLDPSIESLKTFYQNVKNSPFPWTAEVLPLQIFILGELAIVGVPFELTVVAGRRLQKTMEEALKDKGITQIILSPYANGYSGYITTYEEYQVQMYEGGHTVFGEYSLAALQTKLDALAKEIGKPENNRNIQRDVPPQFTEEDLEVFSFYKRKWYIKNESKITVKK
jgi:neutral ceramidase